MDLLDRYVHAVKTYLPRGQQRDISEELSDSILSHIEEKAAERGRALEPAEEEAILRQFGHPMLVASRYRSRQYLIGPALFPFYWSALKLMLWILTGLFVVIGAITVYTTGDVGGALLGFWNAAFFGLGLVTAAFALLEHYQVKLRFLDDWNPRALPPVGTQQVPRSETILGLVFGTIFVLYWLDVPPFDSIVFGGDDVRVQPAPVWQPLYLPILFLSLLNLAQNGINLVRPHWTNLRAVTRVVTDGAFLAVLSILLRADTLVVMTYPPGDPERFTRLAELVNRILFLALVGAGVACLVEVLLNLRRLLRRS